MSKVTRKKKVVCEFHLHKRHEWNQNLIDFTEKKLINNILTSTHDEEKKSWEMVLKEYKNGDIMCGWDHGSFIYHPIVKGSK